MNKWIVALTVIFPTLLEVIDTSVVNVSLGHIGGSLSAGLDESTWTITAYLVANAIIIPLTGWFSRLFGRKNYLLFSVILFTFSSFLCGSAKSLNALVFFRILQGVGGGGLQPISQTILLEAFPPIQHGIAMAIFGIGVLFGPIIGPVLGGWITDNWSWPWIFYINIPVGILSVIMIMLVIKDPPYLNRIKEKIDYWGLSLIVVGIGCLQILLDKGQREDWFSSVLITRLAIISAISLIAFVIVELKAANPVLNLRVFKNIPFSTGNIIQGMVFFILYASIMLLPQFLQQLMGYNAFLAGLVMAPGGIATVFTMPIVGRLVAKINPRIILFTGLSLLGYSLVTMTRFNLFVDYDIVCLSRIILGIGMGMIFIPLITMSFASIKKEEISNATCIFSLCRNIAGSFGIAFITTQLARRAQFHQYRFSEDLNPFNPAYQQGVHQAVSVIGAKAGVASNLAANGLIYQQLARQSSLAAFVDAFYLSAVITFSLLPLVFLLKKPKHSEEPVAIH